MGGGGHLTTGEVGGRGGDATVSSTVLERVLPVNEVNVQVECCSKFIKMSRNYLYSGHDRLCTLYFRTLSYVSCLMKK